ncbi:mitogen-activated protein kinase kinase kinase 19-like isoform X2 [Manihot esculenta]|uniref:Uncharacterized protein n=1 Tax=Manihot esculenta TaxID=3983 RepID=A0ACB7H1R0_MANES|nr:mitogen-activated protein kinase kinase kinase 19-like isoform X2 [Manihot esculenta]KAG8645965.1 hypothetical protein MANES_10G112069v8 [Manihot esculenta]
MSADKFLGDEKAPLVLEFCNLLREVSNEDPLYQSCRTTLRKLLEIGNYEIHLNNGLRTMLQILDFFKESLVALLHGLGETTYPTAHIQSLQIQFRDFRTFSRALCQAIDGQAEADEDGEVDNEDDETDEDDEVNNEDDEHKVDNENDKQRNGEKFIVLYSITTIEVGFGRVMKKMEVHLSRLPLILQVLKYTDDSVCIDAMRSISLLYLAILNELNSMSQLVEGAKDEFRQVLEDHKNSLQLMIKTITRKDDYDWLLEHSAVLDSESMIHLLMMKMIPEEKLRDEELYNPLIRWSKNLDVKLYKKFKKKDLTDSQVLQDWLCKLCQILFKPQNLLFLACPNDPTKFYPNPELEPQPLHWDCFENCGKAIALALMHEVHVGVALHRVFLLQLAGKDISVEDVRDADPSFYNNKANKEPFHDDDQIQNEFIKSISEQIRFFKNGFDSVFGKSIFQQLSDNGIEPDDLNLVLKGSIELEFNSDENLDDKQNDPLMPQDNESDPLTYRYFKVNLQNLNIPEWQQGKRLGEGKFGKVFEGYAPGGFFFAIKEIKIEPEANIEQIYDEIRLLCQLRHPNIVKYYSMEKDEGNLNIFLELVTKGSLKDVYGTFELEDSQVSHYTKQILEGLKYLHERNVVHRDIKCANILVNEKGRIKIADFGLAKVMELNTLMKSSYYGTPGWMAPEVAKSGDYGPKADIWSLGCTVLEMLTRKTPHVMEGGKLLDLPDLPSQHSRDFIKECLQDNKVDRPSAAELLQHPFVKGFGL